MNMWPMGSLQHFVEEIIRSPRPAKTLQVGSVFLLRGIDVQSVVMRVVKEIALDAAKLSWYIWFHSAPGRRGLHFIQLPKRVAGFGAASVLAMNHPVPGGREPFRIGGYRETVDPAEERLGLPCSEIELETVAEGAPQNEARPQFRREQRPGLAGVRLNIVGSCWQSDDSLSDASRSMLILPAPSSSR